MTNHRVPSVVASRQKTRRSPRGADKEVPKNVSPGSRLIVFRGLFKRLPDWAILLVFCALLLLQAIPSLTQESLTFDEVNRLFPGYLHLTAGEFRTQLHGPLIKMLAALPLLFMEVKLPPRPEHWSTLKELNWTLARDFLFRANDADLLILIGRLAVLPLTLLLGVFVFKWAKVVFGRGAAVAALFLYTFEPNILAHGRLMNNDLGVTCFLFLTMYFFFLALEEATIRRTMLVGVSYGLAMVTKHSAVLAVPWFLLLGAVAVLSRRPIAARVEGHAPVMVAGRFRKLLILLGMLMLVGLITYTIIWAFYWFRFEGGTRPEYAYSVSWQNWQQRVEALPVGQRIVLWAKAVKLLPDAFLHGLVNLSEFPKPYAFLMGKISRTGWWYYFIVTFLLKTPLPLLIALCLTPFALRSFWRKAPIAVLCLLVPVVIYFGIASASRLNIGHRHILPIYPFLFVLAGSLWPWVLRHRAVVKGAVAALAIWYVIASVSTFPHYLAYFNELVGGPANGYRYLVDSNLDWGQDLKGLKRYMEEHGIKRVWLSYFGMADPTYYGIAYNYLPSPGLTERNHEREPTPYVAISATNLQGVYFPLLGVSLDYFRDFRERTPIAKIGYSIFLYRLGRPSGP